MLELLVAVTTFGIFIGAISGLLVSGIQAQRRILATQELLSQASYVIEHISRALRMAVKDNMGNCVGSYANYWVNPLYYDGINWYAYSSPASSSYPQKGQGIRLLKATKNGNICQNFYLDPTTSVLKEQTSSDDKPSNFGAPLPLISSNIQITSFIVNVSGDLSGSSLTAEVPNLQPRVTIFLSLAGKQTMLGRPTLKVQTSISKRELDVKNY